MITINYNQLDNICHDIIQNDYSNNSHYKLFLEVLLATGCRAHEVLYSHLWTSSPLGQIFLQPLKNNNPRVFNYADLPSVFADSIINKDFLFYGGELRTYNRYFSQYQTFPNLFVNNSFITYKLFRHRFIKMLSINGFTPTQIMSFTGHKNQNIVAGYINSNIFHY